MTRPRPAPAFGDRGSPVAEAGRHLGRALYRRFRAR